MDDLHGGGLALQQEHLALDLGQVLARFHDEVRDQLGILAQASRADGSVGGTGLERSLQIGNAGLQQMGRAGLEVSLQRGDQGCSHFAESGKLVGAGLLDKELQLGQHVFSTPFHHQSCRQFIDARLPRRCVNYLGEALLLVAGLHLPGAAFYGWSFIFVSQRIRSKALS